MSDFIFVRKRLFCQKDGIHDADRGKNSYANIYKQRIYSEIIVESEEYKHKGYKQGNDKFDVGSFK